jgi:3-deoxy-7-phosphoheptulonate synthase
LDPHPRIVRVKDLLVGGADLVVMAGPCSVESRDQLFAVAEAVAASGALFLRGGAFKTRTRPGTFEGLGAEGLRMLRDAADLYGLLVVSEVLSADQVPCAVELVDLVQVGTRNMQNVPLLRALGRAGVPVLLKRGFGATMDEWFSAAEFVEQEGNANVILCERGIRTFETQTRFTLDISAVPIARARKGLPVIVDPSHASGARQWVRPLALAAVASGCDGLLVEVHPDPERALSDGAQALPPSSLPELMASIRRVAEAVGRGVASRVGPGRPSPS